MTLNAPRVSCASFEEEDARREYMLIHDHYVVHIVARPDFDLSIDSNLSFGAVIASEDWLREVAFDIAELYGAEFSVVLEILQQSL